MPTVVLLQPTKQATKKIIFFIIFKIKRREMVPLELMSTFKNDVVVESTSFLFRWILMSEFFLKEGLLVRRGKREERGVKWKHKEWINNDMLNIFQ